MEQTPLLLFKELVVLTTKEIKPKYWFSLESKEILKD